MAKGYFLQGYFKPKEAVNGQDVVVLINNTFGHYNVHLEAKTILEWNFKRIWGFSHKDWYKASKVQKAFTITDGIVLAPVSNSAPGADNVFSHSLLQGPD